MLDGNTQEFATGTYYGQISRDQAQQKRDPWLLTPLPSIRPHSADPNLAKRPLKENCRAAARLGSTLEVTAEDARELAKIALEQATGTGRTK